jgi:hypothetical protein
LEEVAAWHSVTEFVVPADGQDSCVDAAKSLSWNTFGSTGQIPCLANPVTALATLAAHP